MKRKYQLVFQEYNQNGEESFLKNAIKASRDNLHSLIEKGKSLSYKTRHFMFYVINKETGQIVFSEKSKSWFL